MTDTPIDLFASPRRGDYGVDGDFRVIPARWQAVIVAAIVVALVALTVRAAVAGALVGAVVPGLLTLGLVLFVGCYLRTTLVGKFEVWARVLSDLRLQCGRYRSVARRPDRQQPGCHPAQRRA